MEIRGLPTCGEGEGGGARASVSQDELPEKWVHLPLYLNQLKQN